MPNTLCHHYHHCTFNNSSGWSASVDQVDKSCDPGWLIDGVPKKL